jgi:2-desacetyl-2-hydroxyethyl bacteriochlorophyllide A dehydrogenase
MRALIKTASGVGHLEVLETAAPFPRPGEALVRIGPSGLCGTDLLLYDDRYRGRRRPVPVPLIVGHEAAGEVVELGAGTTWPPLGMRVGIEAVTGCGHCAQCLRGRYNLCPDWHHIGLTCAGVLAELVTLPVSSLLPLPDDVSMEDAAFLEPLATVMHTLERVRPSPSMSAAIVGPGSLGLLHLLVLQAAGLQPVVYGQAGDDARLELAAALGAQVCLGDRETAVNDATERTAGLGFAIAIESAGTSTAIQTALDIVGAAGTLVSLGIVRPTEIDVLQVMRKNLTWIGVVASVRHHFADAIELMRRGRVRPRELITHRLTLQEALDGFAALRRREAVKVMFSPTA